jgi:hypothetical protein
MPCLGCCCAKALSLHYFLVFRRRSLDFLCAKEGKDTIPSL